MVELFGGSIVEKKLREIADAIIDYVIEENLPIQLDNIEIVDEVSEITLRHYRPLGVYYDGDITVDHIYDGHQHYFVATGMTEEEFKELVDKDKLRKRFL